MRTPTHYEEGKRVAFMKTGLRMAGLIFLPPNMEPGRRYPAVVVAHPGGGVKEQVPSLYGWNLAQKGYVALAFDASHQGESEGEPRYLEDPYSRVEDIRAAVDYLTTLEYVDRSRIGAMGVCAGAGYTMSAAINDARIKAAAGVCTWNTGTWIRDGFPYKGRCAMLGQALAAAADARTLEANGEGPVYTHFVPESPADFTDETPQIMKDASDYSTRPIAAAFRRRKTSWSCKVSTGLPRTMPLHSLKPCRRARCSSSWAASRIRATSPRTPTSVQRSPRSFA